MTPRLLVSDGAAAIDFYARAFGAQEIGHRFLDPDGRMVHAEVEIGDSVLVISGREDGATLPEAGATAIMETYWRDVDAAWERALGAGAEVIFPLEDQFYGDRSGRLCDPFGQQWVLSQRIEYLSQDELEERARTYFER